MPRHNTNRIARHYDRSTPGAALGAPGTAGNPSGNPSHPSHHVGETKSVNGVTYRLNENHRWELASHDDPAAAHQHADQFGGAADMPHADRHKLASAALRKVDPTVGGLIRALQLSPEYKKGGEIVTKDIHPAAAKKAYDWMRQNAGHEAGGGYVHDFGDGRLGFASPAGAFIMGADGETRYTTNTAMVKRGGQQQAEAGQSEQEQQPGPEQAGPQEPEQVAERTNAPEENTQETPTNAPGEASEPNASTVREQETGEQANAGEQKQPEPATPEYADLKSELHATIEQLNTDHAAGADDDTLAGHEAKIGKLRAQMRAIEASRPKADEAAARKRLGIDKEPEAKAGAESQAAEAKPEAQPEQPAAAEPASEPAESKPAKPAKGGKKKESALTQMFRDAAIAKGLLKKPEAEQPAKSTTQQQIDKVAERTAQNKEVAAELRAGTKPIGEQPTGEKPAAGKKPKQPKQPKQPKAPKTAQPAQQPADKPALRVVAPTAAEQVTTPQAEEGAAIEQGIRDKRKELKTAKKNLAEAKAKASEPRESYYDLYHQHQATIKQLQQATSHDEREQLTAKLGDLSKKMDAVPKAHRKLTPPKSKVHHEVRKRAESWDMKPEDYDEMLSSLHGDKMRRHEAHTQAYEQARKWTGLSPMDVTRFENKGHDHGSNHPAISGARLDEIGDELAKNYPDLGWGDEGEDHAGRVWELLKGGKPKEPTKRESMDDLDAELQSHWERAMADRGKKPSGGSTPMDMVPFSRGGVSIKYRKRRKEKRARVESRA